MENADIEQIVQQVLANLAADIPAATLKIPVGISNRHIHLSPADLKMLFGADHELTCKKALSQEGEFAAEETVTLVGPKGVLRNVRVLGPVRKTTQVELSRTDGFSLGVALPIRDSGNIKGTPGITIVGTVGSITLQQGVICAARHVHMNQEEAKCFGVSDGDRVVLETAGERGTLFKNVLVRVQPKFHLELHIDTDEANAAGLKNGDAVSLLRHAPQQAAAVERIQPCPTVKEVPAAANSKKRVLDAAAVRIAAAEGKCRLEAGLGTIITPLAWDTAREVGMEIVQEGMR